jgi:radical SAM protein with 4Fe4S-binding SPASM domain
MYLSTHPGVKHTTFENLSDNLLYLADKKESLGVKRPEVTLIYVVVAQNYDGLFDFVNFANRVRADKISFQPVDDIEDPSLSKLVPTADQAAYVRKQLRELKVYLRDKRVNNNINYFLKVFRKQLDTTALYRLIPCYVGWTHVRVQVGGAVYPCHRCYNPLGNVYEKEFSEIWNGLAYRQFREGALRINVRGTPVDACDCGSCCQYVANLKVYRALHPLKARSAQSEQMCPRT